MISVSDEARDYILLKGGCIHVSHSHEIGGCCLSVNLSPTVTLGEPPRVKDYAVAKMNDINVYLPKDFHTLDPLIIGLGQFLGMKASVLKVGN